MKIIFITFIKNVDHIIIETESLVPEQRDSRDTSAKYRMSCPGVSDCVNLRDCPQILVEATSKCYNGDRSLFCGINNNYEPYVCCPQLYPPPYQSDGTNHLPNNQYDQSNKLSGSCGRSLIQGSYYKKLGAYPFVARIGFKSEFIHPNAISV